MKLRLYKVLMVCCALAAGVNICRAQSPSPDLYKAATIPDSLKQEANSVVRYKMVENFVNAPGELINKCHSIVAVLNEKAIDETRIMIPYDKTSSINSFKMNVYNADGTLIKKYAKSDMYDRAAVDGISIITDSRFKAIMHAVASYPVTIEMIYETENDNAISYGSFLLQNPEQSVQDTYCKYLVNPGVAIRYNNVNTKILPQKGTADKMETYTWHISNLKAFKSEEGVPSWREASRVDIAPVKFQYNHIEGDMSTWTGFGKWIQGLNSDVNTLSPARVAELQQMTAHLKSDKEKAKFLYEYMQQNMRYVSIQLGIGGLKPFPAAFVDQKKYGDCKALSNYMYAMLKAVNIPANYAIIRAGENAEPANAAFSQFRFNHAILCIPFKGDTTWLECTSTTQPFGKLGTFTENRNALLITEDGGKLVNTPVTKAEDNIFNSTVLIKLNADGSAKTDIKISGTGEYRNMYLGLAEIPLDKQKEILLRSMHIKQPSFFEFKPAEDKDGVKQVDIELEYDKFSDVITGSKQFYRPAAFDIWTFTCPAAEKRKADFYFEHPLQKTSVTTIELPEGFEVETLPANQSLKFTYGSFDVSYVYDAATNRVTGTTKFNLNKHIIPAAKYTEMQQYMDAVAKAQNKKLVIRRKA
ncbi:DUF3857 domain-containing protein [Mucilaginibacter limnophilus]|uniref:DUF3857 domain-containing protein n=1 Tax=Mucilaginibacter limnophilus TaxID=1932778 RepID=A0A3S2VP37_9SPHI|nr:DUF3857 domain-containing protein [Mucilaginibacter limnophilus]RVU01982.1 DUF3857 domain-containing protein [Mucilaginibacter limnophilus]